MSSMRNAVQRRPHRERAQPLERRRLGLLEKHKDYSMRAKDFNKKKTQLKSLRQKAADRNEDEFYFGMMSRKGAGSRIKNGRSFTGTIEGDRGNSSLDVDTVRLLKTQDIGYIRTMRQVTAKHVAQLEEQVVITRGFDHLDEDEDDGDDDFDDEDDMMPMPAKPKAPRKIVFFDDEQEQEDAVQDHIEQEGDAAEDEDEFEGLGDDKKPESADFERAKSLRGLQKQLDNARKRLKAFTDVENQLGVQRAKMAKTATSGGMTRRGKKIMVRTRKR